MTKKQIKKQVPGGFDDTVKKVLREYAEALLFAIIFAVIIRAFFVSAYKIPTNSMAPTLQVGDFIFAIKWPFGFSLPGKKQRLGFNPPRRGDIVVFSCPHSRSGHCVKRVVALPGDKVQIIKKNLFVNDVKASYKPLHINQESEQHFATPSAVVAETIFNHTRHIVIGANLEFENYGPVVVPPDHFFTLGDARDFTEDSRLWGVVPYTSLQAKVVLIWMSLDWRLAWSGDGGARIRWGRIFLKPK